MVVLSTLQVSLAKKNRQDHDRFMEQSNVIPFPNPSTQKTRKAEDRVSFDRHDLGLLLQCYSKRVGTGEWRDYAIDMLKDRAVFSIFKRASDVPLYTIEKQPKLQRRQGQWSVINATGHVLKRGHDLRQVLRVLEPKPEPVSF